MTYDLHNDEPLFLEALRYTTVRTGFPVRLLEKDYYCGVLLNHLAANTEGIMAFRGGTSLTKVHVDFYRMSEDLDFSVSIPENAARGSRRRLVEPIKQVVREIPTPFTLEQGLIGANRSTQYVAVTSYESRDSGTRERIKGAQNNKLPNYPLRFRSDLVVID